jgi:glycosyltransferase involved in cell wall biosynthesis
VTWLLVLSTVHQADDPRVRVRTVGVLAQRFDVRYATRPPAPSDRGDHTWVALPGGRVRRHLAAFREVWRRDVGLVSLHDPELIPLGLAVRWLRRLPVVFDVHEDVPAQLRTKQWLPAWLRAPLAAVAAVVLRLAERWLTITLAEPGYTRLFHRSHPVLPNYPLQGHLPPLPDSAAVDHMSGHIVYVGDVTEARGASFAIEVVARLRSPRRLRLIGRCAPALRARLQRQAAELGVDLDVPGFLPHDDAMRAVAGAAVGLCPLEDQPNYRYSLPTKVLEYLALGVPVVASDLPGTAELAAGRPGVQLVAPRAAGAWADAVARALHDPQYRTGARAAADEVRAQFCWPAERLLDIYGRLWRPARDTSQRAFVG